MGHRGVLAEQARLLTAPIDRVPYPQPLAGLKPQYVPWEVLLVRPIGHPPGPVPPPAADQQCQAYPTLLLVLRRTDMVTGGGGQTPEVGCLACNPVGPLPLVPPSRCVGCHGGSSATPGWGAVVVVGGRLLATPGCGACVCVPATPGWGSPTMVAGGPSPLLGEGIVCGSPPLLGRVRWWCWRGGPSPLLAEVCWFVHFWLTVLGGRSLATPG